MSRPATRLTTRDFKRASRRAPLDAKRFRDLGIGLAAGAILTAGVFIYKSDAHKVVEPDSPRPEPQQRASTRADADTSTASNESGERYDFYEMLPNFEVVVPEKDREVKRDIPGAARIERPGVYVLQAGSYRNQADAERVSAQLKLQGIDAKVQRVAVDNDVWHRVRVGPISNLTELNKVRKQLQAADVDGLVIRVGD
ncbi:MAG: SPOR domain-containing protein [Gammaproteobacteria bacterium]